MQYTFASFWFWCSLYPDPEATLQTHFLHFQRLDIDTFKFPSLFASDIVQVMTSFGFSGVSFRVPMSWIGTALQGSAKKQFTMIRSKIDFYNLCEIDSRHIVVILDLIENVKTEGYARSVPVLSEVVHYLRSLLLSADTELVYHTLVLLDHIVKNSGFILHVMIGRRKFMKTMSHVARKHTAEIYYANKRVGNLALDCIQAWGEAFYPREEHYPHICHTYTKLKYKYKMHFPRPDFDPTRVPIFLDDVSRIEKAMAYSFNNEVELNYDRLEECKEEPLEAKAVPPTAPHRSIPPLKPPRGYGSETFSQTNKNDTSPDLIQFSTSSDAFPMVLPEDDVPSFVQRYGDTYTTHYSSYQPSAVPGVPFGPDWMQQQSAQTAAERVLALYPPTFASHPTLSTNLSLPYGHVTVPTTNLQVSPLPRLPQQQVSPDPRVGPAMTHWDLYSSASSQTATISTKSSNEASRATSPDTSWLSNDMRPTGHHDESSHSNNSRSGSKVSAPSWDLAGALDLSKLSESLPAVREKSSRTKPPLPPLKSTSTRAPPTLRQEALTVDTTSVQRLPSPRAAVSNDVVAEALAEFQLKMSSDASLPAYPPPPVPTVAGLPRVPSPPPPTPVTVSPEDTPLQDKIPAITESAPQVVKPPPVPQVPAPAFSSMIAAKSLMMWDDTSLEDASPPGPPRDPWSQLALGPPPQVPPSVPTVPAPVPTPVSEAPFMDSFPTEEAAEEAAEETERVSTSSSEEDPILNLIQSMGRATLSAAPADSHSDPSPSMDALGSPSRVPRIPAPVPGPARPKRSDFAPPLMHFEEPEEPPPHLSQQDHLPQQPQTTQKSARQHHVSKSLSFPQRVQTDEDAAPFERFDPTAGPKPEPPKKPSEPRKVSFSSPSSDPLNEIKYYGNQRVVIRRI